MLNNTEAHTLKTSVRIAPTLLLLEVTMEVIPSQLARLVSLSPLVSECLRVMGDRGLVTTPYCSQGHHEVGVAL